MSSVRESLSYTLSTNLRNRRQYPETNDFVVELPMPVRNVVSLSLQRMEMNLSQTLVREGVNDTFRFREGLRLGGKSADDTAFELSVEGGGPSQRVSLPSFMNPILTISGTGPIVITTYRDVGLPVGALTVADMDALGIEMYLFGATAASGGTPGRLSLRRAAEATPVSVTGANELRIETAFFDTSSISGGGILPDNKYGDDCRGLFLVCEPLSVGAVAAVLSRHASASGVACTYDEASDRFRFSHDGGRALSVAEAGGAAVAGPSALVALGFFHGQAGEALTARSAPPFYEARLHPGNYDLSGMAKNVCSAINPGALTPFSTYGIEEAAREASKLGVALFVVERGGGALAHVEVPASYVFVSPRQLAGYLSAAHEATFAPVRGRGGRNDAVQRGHGDRAGRLLRRAPDGRLRHPGDHRDDAGGPGRRYLVQSRQGRLGQDPALRGPHARRPRRHGHRRHRHPHAHAGKALAGERFLFGRVLHLLGGVRLPLDLHPVAGRGLRGRARADDAQRGREPAAAGDARTRQRPQPSVRRRRCPQLRRSRGRRSRGRGSP